MSRKLSPFVVVVAVSAALAIGAAVTLAQGPQPAGAPNIGLTLGPGVGPGFTYQGRLQKNGIAVDGICAIDFTLWNAPNSPSGSQNGGVQTLNPVTVTNGLFTVLLNAAGEFGPNAFTGDSRWLQADVKCPVAASPVPLTRQPLSAAPYALSLRPGALISAFLPYPGTMLSITNSADGNALYAHSAVCP
jgi:hypothetical protein